VSVEVVRLLLRAGASEMEVEDALGRAVSAGRGLARLVGEGEPELERRLERELVRVEVPSLELVRPETEQLALLPPGLAERLGVVPVRKDVRSGRVDVAALDPLDTHVVTELEFHLGAKVRVLRADPEVIGAALGGATSPRSPSNPPLPLVRRVSSPESQLPPPGVAESAPAKAIAAVPANGLEAAPTNAPEPARATDTDSEPPPSGDDPVLPLARPKSTRQATPPGPLLPLELARSAFEQTRTPDDIVTALIEGTAPARTVVLAVRSTSYVGRAGSAAFERDSVRRIEILNSSPSVLQTAARAGFYLGALPHTPAHAELRALFGDNDDEVYVAAVRASEHPTLVVIADPALLGGSLEATRRIDALAEAAGQALERILLQRKRGA
jgi:hypothetical protein